MTHVGHRGLGLALGQQRTEGRANVAVSATPDKSPSRSGHGSERASKFALAEIAEIVG